MSHRQRLWLTTLILAGVFLTAALVTPPGGAPTVIAQVATPTLTPTPAAPTPTQTTAGILGVAAAVDWLKGLWDRFGW
jgi:hypothetical protein